MKNGPISVEQAESMLAEYRRYMEEHRISMATQTHSVSFSSNELLLWLSKVMPYADELRVFFGAYTKQDPNADRLTAILWPYKGGKPATEPLQGKDGGDGKIPPYNQGGLNP